MRCSGKKDCTAEGAIGAWCQECDCLVGKCPHKMVRPQISKEELTYAMTCAVNIGLLPKKQETYDNTDLWVKMGMFLEELHFKF